MPQANGRSQNPVSSLKSGVYYAKLTASLNMAGGRCEKDKMRKISVD